MDGSRVALSSTASAGLDHTTFLISVSIVIVIFPRHRRYEYARRMVPNGLKRLQYDLLTKNRALVSYGGDPQ